MISFLDIGTHCYFFLSETTVNIVNIGTGRLLEVGRGSWVVDRGSWVVGSTRAPLGTLGLGALEPSLERRCHGHFHELSLSLSRNKISSSSVYLMNGIEQATNKRINKKSSRERLANKEVLVVLEAIDDNRSRK